MSALPCSLRRAYDRTFYLDTASSSASATELGENRRDVYALVFASFVRARCAVTGAWYAVSSAQAPSRPKETFTRYHGETLRTLTATTTKFFTSTSRRKSLTSRCSPRTPIRSPAYDSGLVPYFFLSLQGVSKHSQTCATALRKQPH